MAESLKLSLIPFPSDFQESQNFSFKTSDLLKSPGFDSSSKVLDTETGEIVNVYLTFQLIQISYILRWPQKLETNISITFDATQ